MDCTVSVGLGHGNRDQQLMHLSAMLQFASQSMAGGLKIVSQKNLYNMGSALIKNMGFANVQDFLTDPDQVPDQPNVQQQNEEREQQLKNKELDIRAADVQVKAQKVQIEAQDTQMDARLKAAELQLEAQQNRSVAIGDT